jgi:autotransporter-associated beta strand protein
MMRTYKRGVARWIGAWLIGLVAGVRAGSSGWAVDADGEWAVEGNWDAGVPGASSLLNSLDVATFGTALTAGRAVAVDANRNVGGVVFAGTGGFGYTLTGGGLLLSNGGSVQNAAQTGDHTDTVSAPLVILGDGGAASFSAHATSAVSRLVLGDVSGVSTAGKTTTLTLGGDFWNTENEVAGAISDGAGGGKLAVVKSGITNTWVLSGANTFSGGVAVQEGIIVAENDAALGAGTVTVSVGAGLALRGGVTVSGKTLALTGSTPATYGSLDSFGGTNVWEGDVIFTNATPRLNVANGVLIIRGNVAATHLSGNSTLGGFGYGEIRGVISGPSTKTLFRSSSDTGTWALLGTNTFLGNVTCANGTLVVNNDKSLGSKTVTAAAGLTLGGSATRGTLRAIDDVTLSVRYGVTLHGGGGRFTADEGMTLTVNGIIVNRSATPTGTVVKEGLGTLVLGAANTFTTELHVVEGVVTLAHASALAGSSGVKPGLHVSGALNLGGTVVSTPVLRGADGVISNGAFSVTAGTLLGGDGARAPLALPGGTTLAGTLSVDVAADGTSDCLEVDGELTLSGLALTVADAGNLSKAQVYTLAACAGGAVVGRFAGHNLTDGWWVDYTEGQIRLRYAAGMIMTVR